MENVYRILLVPECDVQDCVKVVKMVHYVWTKETDYLSQVIKEKNTTIFLDGKQK